MRKALVAMAAGSALLGGCATIGIGGDRAGSELVGHSARLVTNNGQRSTLHFEEEGRVRAAFAGGEARGRWWARERQLCFEWGGQQSTRECWPYTQRFRTGQTRTVTSTRGNVVRVTLL